MGFMNLAEINKILGNLGFEKRFNTEQTAVCIYVMFSNGSSVRIHDIIVSAKELLNKSYAENTRESIRKLSLKRLVDFGLCIRNSDDPKRPINSGSTNYILEPLFSKILSSGGSTRDGLMGEWKSKHKEILKKISEVEKGHQIPIRINKEIINLSYGEHNILIREIVEKLLPSRFRDFRIFYLGDTKDKMKYKNQKVLDKLNFELNVHDKLPDVMAYSEKVGHLLIVESVTSVGAIEDSRKKEISELLSKSVKKRKAITKVVYVTAFLSFDTFARFSKIISFGTDVWIAERPQNLIIYL